MQFSQNRSNDQFIFKPINNKKSVNVKDLNSDEYVIYNIPAVKKRVFLNADYSILKNLKEGE